MKKQATEENQMSDGGAGPYVMNQFSPIVDKIPANISERSWKLAGTNDSAGRLVKFAGAMDKR